MRRFELDDTVNRVTVEIDGNTLRATFHNWVHGDFEITPEIPETLRPVVPTIETFSARPGFVIETGEIDYPDDAGECYDTGDVIKFYDDAHGGGFVWRCSLWADVIWGTARANLAVLPDGTVRREPTPRTEVSAC